MRKTAPQKLCSVGIEENGGWKTAKDDRRIWEKSELSEKYPERQYELYITKERGKFMVSMRSLFAYFWVDKPRVIYFVLCCLIILVLAKKHQEIFARKLFRYIVSPAVILLVVLLNPVVAHLLVTKYTETQALRLDRKSVV